MTRPILTYLTFWTLEPPFDKGRLRYHLGQLFMLEQIKHRLNQGNTCVAVVCDPAAILESRAYSSARENREQITKFLRALAHPRLSIVSMSEQVEAERARDPKSFDERAQSFLTSYHQLQKAVDECAVSSQALEDLKKYREPANSERCEESLIIPLEQLRSRTGLSQLLGLATLFAYKHRASWFEANSLAATGAYLSSYAQRQTNRLILLEARRNAYPWLMLRALFECSSIGNRTDAWPEAEFTDNVPGLNGNSYMRLEDSEGCLFLDTPMRKVVGMLRELAKPVESELFRVFEPIRTEEYVKAPNYFVELIRDYRCRAGKRGFLKYSGDAALECGEEIALVIKGGGMKGLAIVGALSPLWKHFRFNRVVGTSAGAIIAVLLAAGYNPNELREILLQMDFEIFKERSITRVIRNVIKSGALHSATQFEEFFERKLKAKIPKLGSICMKDLPIRTVIFAVQQARGTIRFDSEGENRDAAVTYAVRSSMAIPFYFTPASRDGKSVYDGGVLNNYPYRQFRQLFNDSAYIGIYLKPDAAKRKAWHRLVPQRIADLWGIWTGQDEAEIVDQDQDHVVVIDPAPIGTTDFKLSNQEKEFLLALGEESGERFLVDRGLAMITDLERATDKSNRLRERITRDRVQGSPQE